MGQCEACRGKRGLQWAWRCLCRVCGLGRSTCMALEEGCLHNAESESTPPRGPPASQQPVAQQPATRTAAQPPAAPRPAAQAPAAQPSAPQSSATPPPAAQPATAQQPSAQPPAADHAFAVRVVWGTDCASAPVRLVPRSALRSHSAPPSPVLPSLRDAPTEEKPLGVRSSTEEAWERRKEQLDRSDVQEQFVDCCVLGAHLRARTRFTLPDHQGEGCWWFCVRADGSQDFFVESSPAPWTQCQDLSGGLYWHNGVTEEFSDTLEAVSTQPPAAQPPAAQQPATPSPAAEPPASQQPAAQPPAAHQEKGPKEGPKQ